MDDWIVGLLDYWSTGHTSGVCPSIHESITPSIHCCLLGVSWWKRPARDSFQLRMMKNGSTSSHLQTEDQSS
jgi:hypothetical protein